LDSTGPEAYDVDDEVNFKLNGYFKADLVSLIAGNGLIYIDSKYLNKQGPVLLENCIIYKSCCGQT
jgi:hypothetical protein